MYKRVNYLENKYKLLLDRKIFINSISKHFAKGTYNSLLESTSACGTANLRRNNIYKGIGFLKNWEGISIFLDAYIDKKFLKYKSKFNVALLVESKSVKPDIYKRIFQLEKHFDLILTHDREILINFENKARYVPASIVSIGETYFGTNFNDKKFLISFNYSEKKDLPGHKLRHLIAKRYENISTKILHRLGSGPQGIRIIEKGEMLKPYHFSICIENTEYSDYFTEKILDCFASGVIPIYWGTKNVQKYFNPKGILFFNTIQELDQIISNIEENGLQIYESMQVYVEENYKLSRSFLMFDDLHLLEILDFIESKKGLDFFNNIISINPKINIKKTFFEKFLENLLGKI